MVESNNSQDGKRKSLDATTTSATATDPPPPPPPPPEPLPLPLPTIISGRSLLTATDHEESPPSIRGTSIMRGTHINNNLSGDADVLSTDEAEVQVRNKAKHQQLYLFVVNGYAAVLVFALYLISWETIFGCALSVGLTVFTYYEADDTGTWDGSAMDWVLLSFAVVTPLSASIGMAFRRREEALRRIAAFRALSYEIYLGHAVWDWTKAGKDPSGKAASAVDWLRHCDAVLVELIAVGDELCRFLTLPNVSRARHRVTPRGRAEAARTTDVAYRLFHSLVTVRMGHISKLCEVLKTEGLPPNEASRIRQWEQMVVESVETLRMYKTYRTPQALRSFARLFTVFLPPFYAPFYAQLARDLNSLGMGITFSVFTTLALTALFESICVLEDPFVATLTLDGIDVHEELTVLHYHQLVSAREMAFPDALPYAEEEERQRLLAARRECVNRRTSGGKKASHPLQPVVDRVCSPQGAADAESTPSFSLSRTSSYAALSEQR